MQQRYYDPIAGRFLSVDPIVTDANTGKGFGLYTYVDNNPYSKVDPDGQAAVLAVAVPVVVVGLAHYALPGREGREQSIANGFRAVGNAIKNILNSEGEAKPEAPVEGATGGDRFGRGPRIWEKPSENPVDDANKDFDDKFPDGKGVSDKGDGVRVGTKPDGSRVIVRPGSSEGSGNAPTIEIQNPRGKPTDKIRYPVKPPPEPKKEKTS